MENKNRDNSLYIIIVVLCIIIASLVGFIIYEHISEKDNNDVSLENKNEINNESIDNEDTSLNDNQNQEPDNWMDYVINSEITEIKLIYCDDSSGFPEGKSVNIKKSDLSRIFNEIKKGSLVKTIGGLGGPCVDSLDITYKKDDNQYKLSMAINKVIDPKYVGDQKILTYLEESDYIVKGNIENELGNYLFQYEYNDDIVDTILSEYIK